MSYVIRRKHVGNKPLFQELALESGKLYSETVRFFWRTVRKKNIWLKPAQLKRHIDSDQMHAHSADAAVEAFTNSLKSWRQKRKNDYTAKPPKRLRKYYPVTWKSSAIKIKNNQLILSNGRNKESIILNNWQYDKPVQVIMRWIGKQYEMIFTFKDNSCISNNEEFIETDENKIVGVDIGQIHTAVCSNGISLNGKYLRSLRQWRDKKLSDIQSKMDSIKKGGKRWRRLKSKKLRFLRKANNKIDDILHKYMTGLVATQKRKGVTTLVIGDLSGYRQNNDCGHTRNQENHQWLYGKITHMIQYKAKKLGLNVILQEESYTSKTCPRCGYCHKNSPKGRNFVCKSCHFNCHRDLVGSINIKQKYLGNFGLGSQVVADMAPASGVRYDSHISVTQGFGPRESAGL